ncbi:sigma-70 region 4 domain-containing protein [Stakelama sp. CBK3Z-3]|uniref:Sigma-70 region 4 domain-containing protein n=1 Tax=Stakelama flava TaxID=2860338 RepID=A0ABS6XQA9_9SPHN|nr:sigma factor-like helix-turn-helix DNA-binding protein [Stakelama flava]MBW4332252.1 sigma-70 region 4 domain-containing protein [Stakelama flava]MBW4332301.1 sigma-70 region 4 domain-containing protein [Stakelama flava]
MTDAATLARMAIAYRRFPERDRAIFEAVRFDNLDYGHAAERHGCSIEEVAQALARVLVALDRAAMEE